MRYVLLLDDLRAYYAHRENTGSANSRAVAILTVLAYTNVTCATTIVALVLYHHIEPRIFLGLDHPIAIVLLVVSLGIHVTMARFHPFTRQNADQASVRMPFRTKLYLTFSGALFVAMLVAIVVSQSSAQ